MTTQNASANRSARWDFIESFWNEAVFLAKVNQHCFELRGSQSAHANLAIPDLVAVMLQINEAGLFLRETRHVFKLAAGDQLIELCAAEFELHHLDAIEPILNLVALSNDADLVPFADRLELLVLRRDQRVE